LFDLATRKAECLTPGNYHEAMPAWSPDGSSIAFVSKRGADFDRHQNHDIYVIEAKLGAEPRQLTTFEGADCDPDWESRPAWSLDRNMVQPRWSADGKSVYCLVEDDGNRHLAKIALAGGKIERVLAGRRSITGFDLARDGKIAILDSTVHQPAEVYALDSGPRPLSRQNDKLLEQLKLASVDEIAFKSADGTEIHGFTVKPLDYQAGKMYPTLLQIHGGPVGQYGNEFTFSWQLYAAKGYLVVAANPRGSSGRGEAFAKAIYADWGNLDKQDELAAVDHVVARGLADPARLGVGGWSYGAMLTNYVIASDTRFKAAVSGAGTSNILGNYGTDMYVREYEAELGPPWKNPEAWMRVSYPFLHADRIVTPTLFLCGEKDFNVPLISSEQMYQALSSLGRDTQLIIYPGQFHDITRPSFQQDRTQRYLDWYKKYLGESERAAASR
jgi:dipeptidyl aminopeptidase/acylaminoacyl peptidase